MLNLGLGTSQFLFYAYSGFSQTQDMDPDALIQPHSDLKLENSITCNLRALSSSLAASRRSSMSISTSGISSS